MPITFQWDLRKTPEQRMLERLQSARPEAIQLIEELTAQGQGLTQQAGPMQPGQFRDYMPETDPAAFIRDRARIMGGLLTNVATRENAQQLLNQQFQPKQEQKPTSLMQNFMALLELRKKNPELAKEFEGMINKPTTSINIGTEKPLGEKSINWRNDKGESPPPMMPMAQAWEQGFKPESAESRKSIEAATATTPIMGKMIGWSFGGPGEKSIFPPAGKGSVQRGIGGINAYLQGISGSDERIALYNDTKAAMATTLSRLVGQVGTLTDRDVNDVIGLFPTAGFTPEPLAREKFKTIANLLEGKGVTQSMLKDMGFPDWSLGLPKGVPVGSRWYGTDPASGKAVYIAPNGKKYIED